MGKGYILVEGHGETGAAENLVTRLWANLGLEHLVWKPSARLPNIQYEKGIRKGCNRVRAKGDAAALLIICDDDDGCPRETAPGMARWVAAENLPFPAALVLMHREYEVLFLPCVHLMAGKPLCDPRAVPPRRDHVASSAPVCCPGLDSTGFLSIFGVSRSG